MMQGLTAHDFTTQAYEVRAGDIAVVHAARAHVDIASRRTAGSCC
jgi:hypothetical protein